MNEEFTEARCCLRSGRHDAVCVQAAELTNRTENIEMVQMKASILTGAV